MMRHGLLYLVMAIGLLGLVGWITDLETLTSLYGGASMKVSTAVGLFCIAVGFVPPIHRTSAIKTFLAEHMGVTRYVCGLWVLLAMLELLYSTQQGNTSFFVSLLSIGTDADPHAVRPHEPSQVTMVLLALLSLRIFRIGTHMDRVLYAVPTGLGGLVALGGHIIHEPLFFFTTARS